MEFSIACFIQLTQICYIESVSRSVLRSKLLTIKSYNSIFMMLYTFVLSFNPDLQCWLGEFEIIIAIEFACLYPVIKKKW